MAELWRNARDRACIASSLAFKFNLGRSVSAASGGVEGVESAREVGLQILDVLQPDMQPQARSARRPFGGGAIIGAVEGNDETLEAAP